MDSENHIPLSDLIKSLSEGVNALNSGDASKEEVHQMLALSRELHERLTVLRFKAFEATANSEDSQLKDDVISEAQIDLIDSIEEVSLAEKHQRKPLSSVGEGLTILERANYTSALYSNDDKKFNDMLDAVDDCGTVEEAMELFRETLNPSGRKEDIESAKTSFEERIPRIFLRWSPAN